MLTRLTGVMTALIYTLLCCTPEANIMLYSIIAQQNRKNGIQTINLNYFFGFPLVSCEASV